VLHYSVMMKHLCNVLVLLSALSLAAGCQNKGPVPQEESATTGAVPQVGSAEVTGAHPGAANPHQATNDPHAGLEMPKGPSDATTGQPDASGMIDVGAVSFKLADGWQALPPASSMRRAQLTVLGSQGPAELIVYYFGPRGAGTAKDNLDRWVGQFTTAEGNPVTDAEVTSSTVGDHTVDRVEVSGQYASGMGASGSETPKANQRLIGAIVNTGAGPYYFKLLGPDATVREKASGFDAMIDSIVASP